MGRGGYDTTEAQNEKSAAAAFTLNANEQAHAEAEVQQHQNMSSLDLNIMANSERTRFSQQWLRTSASKGTRRVKASV